MNQHEKLNYIELPARDLGVMKTFFTEVFAFEFTDYGPEYTAFKQSASDSGERGIEGGFYLVQLDLVSNASSGSALIVFYSSDLESTMAKIEPAGGIIHKDIFSFPGGRRFHFLDPNGNEWAVWSDKA